MVGLLMQPYGIQGMLKEGHQHLSGFGLDEAVLKNIDACEQLPTITCTSLGPNVKTPASASASNSLFSSIQSIKVFLGVWDSFSVTQHLQLRWCHCLFLVFLSLRLLHFLFAKLGGFGTVNGNVGHMGLNQNQGFFGFQEQFQVDPFGVGGLKNSKELSSTPNGVKCY
ncbi:unnamed protein product [Fraxinus pennsylvanica]|uniref:Uncharacterized protein n=1 Tax=Fraxinus pennsylvanica TaxID=56036 RepID=A0AAD2EAV8_9LAMI|nr:unnamed protein product [Fraxinus pennsylvanica]